MEVEERPAHSSPTIADEAQIFEWARIIHGFGLTNPYGYRMPGSAEDHATAHWLATTLASFGVPQVELEAAPLALALPKTWTLAVEGQEIPAGFIRYCGFTPEEGVEAELVHVGVGDEAGWAGKDVAGRIVVVDLHAGSSAPRMGPTYFSHDPADICGRDDWVAWPLPNLAASYQEAVRRGAAGWVGVLEVFGDDTHEYHHWYAGYEAPALTVSALSGVGLRAAAQRGARARMVVTGERREGVGYNVYGTIPGRSDEVLVLKSHYDGWATNEASGAAVTLAIAQALVGPDAPKLDRTVLIFLRSSHFGVGWTMGPGSWHGDPQDAERVYGLSPGRQAAPCRAVDLLPRTVAVNNIEMVGALHVRTEEGWVRREQPAPRFWGVTGPEGGANPVLLSAVCKAIRTHGLEASRVSNFLVGDGWEYARHGVPLVNFISHNVWQFTRRDTLDTIYRPDLPRVAEAFLDILQAQDRATAASLRPAFDAIFGV